MYFKLPTFLLTALWGILWTGAQAQGPGTEEKSLCWEISGNGLSKPSYLFGTIHLIPKKDLVISDNARKAFETCSTLAMEVDLEMDKETKEKVANSTIIPDNKTVEDLLTKEEWEYLQKYMKDSADMSGIKITIFKRVKPFYLSSIILKEMISDEESYEETFGKMADKRKMKKVGLELITEQLALLDSVPMEQQVKSLMEGISNGKSPKREYQKLINIYKNQDLNGMSIMMKEEAPGIDQFEERFLNRRNRNWIPKMEEMAKKESTFFAVGAGHLGGDQGVISLLRKKGYTVKPIY
jgi:uncharacterized protein YbaP (TraB family)